MSYKTLLVIIALTYTYTFYFMRIYFLIHQFDNKLFQQRLYFDFIVFFIPMNMFAHFCVF